MSTGSSTEGRNPGGAADPFGRSPQRPDVHLGAVPADVPCVCRPFGPPPIRRLFANTHTCDLDISMSPGDMGRMVELIMRLGGHVPRENRLDGATLDAVRSPEFAGLARLSLTQFAQLLREFLLHFAGSIYWHAELGNTEPPGRVASGVYAGFQSLMCHPWATPLAMHILDGPLWLSPGFVAPAMRNQLPRAAAPPGPPCEAEPDASAVRAQLHHTKLAGRMTSVLHHFCITYLLVHADLMLHDPANTAEPLVAALKRYGPVHRALRLATSSGASLVRMVAPAEAETIEVTLAEDGRVVVTASRCAEVRVDDSIVRVNGRGLTAGDGSPLTVGSVQAAWARQCADRGGFPPARAGATVAVELVPRPPPDGSRPVTTLAELQRCITSRIRGVIELTRDRNHVPIGPATGLRVVAPACLLEIGDIITHVAGCSLSDKPFEEARLYFLERLTKVETTAGQFTYAMPTLAVRRGPHEKFTVEGHLRSALDLRFAPVRDGRCRCKEAGLISTGAVCPPCVFKTVCCTAMQEVWGCGVVGWAMSPQLLLKVAQHMPDIVRRHGCQHDMLPETHDMLPNVAIRCSPQTGLPTGGFTRVTLATREAKFMLVPMSVRERLFCKTVFRCNRALASTGSAARFRKGAITLPREIVELILTFILPDNVVYTTLLSGTHTVPVPEYITMISAHRIAIANHYHGAGMHNAGVVD